MLDRIVAQRCGPQITQMDTDAVATSHFNAEAQRRRDIAPSRLRVCWPWIGGSLTSCWRFLDREVSEGGPRPTLRAGWKPTPQSPQIRISGIAGALVDCGKGLRPRQLQCILALTAAPAAGAEIDRGMITAGCDVVGAGVPPPQQTHIGWGPANTKLDDLQVSRRPLSTAMALRVFAMDVLGALCDATLR
jgi:hypothetical protein